jgi:hypothetical protein
MIDDVIPKTSLAEWDGMMCWGDECVLVLVPRSPHVTGRSTAYKWKRTEFLIDIYMGDGRRHRL